MLRVCLLSASTELANVVLRSWSDLFQQLGLSEPQLLFLFMKIDLLTDSSTNSFSLFLVCYFSGINS